MPEFEPSNAVNGLNLKEEVEACTQSILSHTHQPITRHTFHKHPEEVGQVEVPEKDVKDAVNS